MGDEEEAIHDRVGEPERIARPAHLGEDEDTRGGEAERRVVPRRSQPEQGDRNGAHELASSRRG
jgi:hypothetical protein